MVVILLGSGFEEAEALVPADLMRRAGIEVALVSVTGQSEVSGGHGMTVIADHNQLSFPAGNVDLVMLPGGMGGVQAIESNDQALRFITDVLQAGGKAAAICAAPTILARLGLLNGRKAVCYPGMEGELTGALPQADSRVVTDGPFITGEAAGSAFDFGLKLVEILRGKAVADKVKHDVYYYG